MIESGFKPGFLAPKGTLEKKPPHGAPCNRCGLCCVATLCPLGRHVFKRAAGPCPALRQDPDGAVCELVTAPIRHAMSVVLANGEQAASDAARHLIGSATGCDARFNGEPADQDFYARLRQIDRDTRAQTRRARHLWRLP